MIASPCALDAYAGFSGVHVQGGAVANNDESDGMTENYTFKREDVGSVMCPFCYAKTQQCKCQKREAFSGRYEIVSIESTNKLDNDNG